MNVTHSCKSKNISFHKQTPQYNFTRVNLWAVGYYWKMSVSPTKGVGKSELKI